MFRALRHQTHQRRSSWSAREDKTVVANLWQDRFERHEGRFIYHDTLTGDTRPGVRELFSNLKWEWECCDRRFNANVLIAKDRDTQSRSIKECFPGKMVMRLIHLDLESGAFFAEAESP
ncbi:MAG: hypothetical protein Q8M24_00045 [Pseudolabrys sp.]|nr:hypothetical protein [Pseudolabrys sp.]MDP2293838.1 hypothetical protein [Pseudolabrys sp.]